tara:strand:- start:1031 stop:1669 length:639 start_codon:yes stop_codon:yes gene_type:complete
MNNLTISIFKNKILLEIIKEIKLFSRFKIKYYEDLDLCIKESKNNSQILIIFFDKGDQKNYKKLKEVNFPIIIVNKVSNPKNIFSEDLVEYTNIPFKIFDLHKKIILLFARYEFKKSSLINLNGYTVDKNERKIKKNKIELQLTEKEINFLILFSENKKPLTRDFFLKTVWNYSAQTDTHTIETHIHRLRKKIFEKFNDNNFIKNNEKGYYI